MRSCRFESIEEAMCATNIRRYPFSVERKLLSGHFLVLSPPITGKPFES